MLVAAIAFIVLLAIVLLFTFRSLGRLLEYTDALEDQNKTLRAGDSHLRGLLDDSISKLKKERDTHDRLMGETLQKIDDALDRERRSSAMAGDFFTVSEDPVPIMAKLGRYDAPSIGPTLSLSIWVTDPSVTSGPMQQISAKVPLDSHHLTKEDHINRAIRMMANQIADGLMGHLRKDYLTELAEDYLAGNRHGGLGMRGSSNALD